MPTQKEVIEAALNELRKRREQIDRTIAGLEEELGISSSEVQPAPIESKPTGRNIGITDTGDVSRAVYEGQFYGKSQSQAARELLSLIRRPLKTAVIAEALTKAGMKIQALGTLYTSLSRSSDFVLVLPNTWGLREWYPEAAAKSIQAGSKVKRKRGRPRKTKTENQDET